MKRAPDKGRALRHVVPIVNYEGVYPQSAESVSQWFNESGLRNIEVFRPGHLVGRGVRAES